ncbi:MAG: BamA/TamA family outer membrane protein [Chitinophagaceae bacterium]
MNERNGKQISFFGTDSNTAIFGVVLRWSSLCLRSIAYLHTKFSIPLILLGCIAFFLTSCSSTKGLEKEQKLYMGSTIHLKNMSDSTPIKNIDLEEELGALLRPEPNGSLLGMPIKLWIYNWGGPASKKGFFRNIFHKIGTPPVVASYGALQKNREILQNRLENKGYFWDSVTVDTTVKKRRLTATYNAYLDSQYFVRKVSYEFDTITPIGKTLTRVTRNWPPRKAGKPYSLDDILGDRTRIDAWLKRRGFYYFDPNYIITLADTTTGHHQVDEVVKLKNSTPADIKKQFRINDIVVFSNYNIGTDTTLRYLNRSPKDSGYLIVDSAKIVKPVVFARLLGFKKGELYNSNTHSLAMNRLSSLGMYKFVKLRFQETDTVNKPGYWLNAYYYLTPATKKSIRFETSGFTKSNSSNGGEMSINWTNRNLFRGAEVFNVKLYGSLEKQVISGDSIPNISTRKVGIQTSITIPRIIAPVFFKTNPDFVAQTKVQMSYEFYTRSSQYTLNSFNTSYGFVWRQSELKEHQLNVLSFTYVRPTHITDAFQLALDTNVILRRSIEKQFIIGSTYNYNYSTLNSAASERKKHNFFLNANLDLSGNLLGIITGADVNKDKEKKLFGTPFSQYIRGEVSFAHYMKVGRNATLASRVIGGLGYSWGNSTTMPFSRSFFVGGPNDLRAFSIRSLGPGSYYAGNPRSAQYYLGDQPGDMKLELNTELRKKLFSIVQGAVFVDAGNTWLIRNDPTRPGGRFSNQFYKQVAIGSGAGLRFDVSVLVLRVDVGVPLRGPVSASDGFLWHFRNMSWSWVQSNWIWNIAIGYPF